MIPQFIKNLFLLQDAPTRLAGRVVNLDAGKWVKLVGQPLGRHRRWITITNEDNTDKVHVIRAGESDPDLSTEKLMTIWPNTSATLWTSDDVVIKNLNGAAAISELQILECFYI